MINTEAGNTDYIGPIRNADFLHEGERLGKKRSAKEATQNEHQTRPYLLCIVNLLANFSYLFPFVYFCFWSWDWINRRRL